MWSPIPSDLSVQKVTGPELFKQRAMQEGEVYYVYRKLEHEAKQAHCESSRPILTT